MFMSVNPVFAALADLFVLGQSLEPAGLRVKRFAIIIVVSTVTCGATAVAKAGIVDRYTPYRGCRVAPLALPGSPGQVAAGRCAVRCPGQQHQWNIAVAGTAPMFHWCGYRRADRRTPELNRATTDLRTASRAGEMCVTVSPARFERATCCFGSSRAILLRHGDMSARGRSRTICTFIRPHHRFLAGRG